MKAYWLLKDPPSLCEGAQRAGRDRAVTWRGSDALFGAGHLRRLAAAEVKGKAEDEQQDAAADTCSGNVSIRAAAVRLREKMLARTALLA